MVRKGWRRTDVRTHCLQITVDDFLGVEVHQAQRNAVELSDIKSAMFRRL